MDALKYLNPENVLTRELLQEMWDAVGTILIGRERFLEI
jgi:hypothetical protein